MGPFTRYTRMCAMGSTVTLIGAGGLLVPAAANAVTARAPEPAELVAHYQLPESHHRHVVHTRRVGSGAGGWTVRTVSHRREVESDGDTDDNTGGGGNPMPGPAAPTTTTLTASSGFEACVIARESGGNPRAVNPTSGAGGLFQFLPSTWSSLGYSGLPENASVATQTQAFWKLFAQAGKQPWSPSDGC
jgi:resuscitation-promoting factor RpfC